jgi:hypothetical protein
MEEKYIDKFSDFGKMLFPLHVKKQFYKPVVLTKSAKELLLDIVNIMLEYTFIVEEKESVDYADQYTEALCFLKYRLKEYDMKINLSKGIALILCHIDTSIYFPCWLVEHPDFESAMQWITNTWNKKYCHSDLIGLK